jgi:hypothetical protein
MEVTKYDLARCMLLNNTKVVTYRIPRSGSAKNNSKNRCRNFREVIFFKKINFCTIKKRILEYL